MSAAAALALLLAGPAISRDAQPATVRVEAAGEATLVRAEIEIAAPPETVWRVIYDCAYATRLMEKLKSCRVLARDPAGRWDVREQVIQPNILPRVRTVMRSEYDPPRGVVFRQVEGDVKGQSGQWRLEPSPFGTRAIYENRIVLGLPIGEGLFRQALRAEAGKGMRRLKAASEDGVAAPAAHGQQKLAAR